MKNQKGHKFHGILMLLCCLVPIVLITILPSLNLQSSSVKNGLSVLLLLACPLGHIVMMKFMSHKHQEAEDEKSCHGANQRTDREYGISGDNS